MKLILLGILFLQNAVYASSDLYKNNEEINQALADNMYEPNYFSMLLGLFIVVALIYLTSYLYQKLTKINPIQEQNDSLKAQIISTTPLGQGKNLHVIKVDNKYSLIASTQNNITHIKELDTINKIKE